MKKSLSYKLFIFLLLGFLLKPFNIFADSISIGASPSFIKDTKLSPTESTSFKFTVANTSSFAKTISEKALNEYEININLNVESKIIPTKDIKFSEQNFTLKPSEKKEITVTLPPSKNLKLDKEDNIYITISSSTKSNLGLSYVPSIKIPVFIYTHDNLKSSSNLNKISITDNLAIQNKNSKTIKRSEKKSGNKKIIKYSIPKNKQVLLNEVVVYNKNDISNNKYIYIDNANYNNSNIKSINFNSNNIEFIIDNNTNILMHIENKNILNSIKNQMEDMAKILVNPPTIDYFLENIIVYKNSNYNPTELFLDVNVSNTGDKTIFPEGKITILSNDNIKIKEMPLSTTIINPNTTKSFLTSFFIPTDSDLNKDYKIIVSVDLDGKGDLVEETLYLNLKSSNNNSTLVLAISLISVLAISTLFIIIKKIKKSKYII